METDPLVQKGDLLIAQRKQDLTGQNVSPEHRSHRLVQVGLFVFPTSQFLYALISCTYFLHDGFVFCSGSLIALLVVDVFAAILIAKPWAKMGGVMGAFGLCCGVCVGLLLYCYFMIFFFAYRDLRVFTNVLATDDPARFADAGMLSFAASSKVDASKSVGYKSFADGGVMYCLAPIVDESMASTDAVRFWAVGRDCCGSRSSFQCGDVHKTEANSGVVVLRPQMFVPPAATWMMVQHATLLERYTQGVGLAANVFDTKVAADNSTNIFVDWRMRPYQIQQNHKLKADWFLSGSAVFGILAFALNAILFRGSGKKDSHEIIV